MGFADILEKVGSFGKFQIQHVMMLGFPVLFLASHNLLQNFLAVVPDHHCRVRLEANGSVNATAGLLSGEDLLQVLIPLDGDGRLEKCRMYSSPQWHLLDLNATGRNATEAETQACTQGWQYDDSKFKATIVTEWDLVCGSRTFRQMAQSVYMGGVLVGSIILGWLSDRFGRRRLLLWSHFQMAVSGTCGAFSISYPLFCFWRFLCGMALSGIVLNTFCLSLEWIPTKVRTAVSTYYNYSYTFGQLLLAGIAYGIRDWRWLQSAVAAPFYFFFLYSWWFPESARWLILNDKSEAALKHLKRVAKRNGQEEEGEKLTTAIIKSNMEKELSNVKSTYTVLDLFKTPVMCKTAYCTMLLWFSTSFAYYGLATDLQGFGVDIYLIQVIFGAVDIPAKFVGVLSLSYVGRRFTQGTFLILAGGIIVINNFVPHDLLALRTTLAAIGKGCLATSFSCCYLYAGELYPTVVRQTGMGLVTTMARVGAIMAPIVKLTEDSVAFLPMMIYGSMALFSGTSAFLLPETLNKPLPDTIEEMEGRAKNGTDKEESPKKDEIPLQGTGTSLMGQSI